MAETPIGVDWALVNQHAINWAHDYTFELVGGLTDTTRDAVSTSVMDYFELGQTMGELEDRLAGVFGAVRAELVATTEITRAAAEGERALAREIANAGIAMVEIWNTSNDELVCPICEPLNQKVKGDGWDEGDGPPAHPRCRCFLSHVIKGTE
jgi:hypothetical protein